ncbi:short chain dehydrogenase [Trichoderma arundinaceum]|uniref:Short chain dehydrogenase n=1 Tax=Trichoderma arundinaceum TaxID=490622 RepID=A0A395NJ20_TRIAR|nr:short chain dehydrogenase [Trichoderma arundinaceum]
MNLTILLRGLTDADPLDRYHSSGLQLVAFNDWHPHNKQLVLVTGGNQGIGLDIVKKLVTEQPTYYVLLGCRALSRGAEAITKLENLAGSVSPIEVDITSNESIEACVAQIDRELGRLDVLINNAGIGRHAVEDLPSLRAKMAALFDVNVFGTVEMTDAAIPLLRKAADQGSVPRVVFITSEMGSLGNTLNPSWKHYKYNSSIPYKSSKAAANMIGACFSTLFEKEGWKINCCCPGLRKTAFNNHLSIAMDVEEGAVRAIALATLDKDGPTGTFSNIDGTEPW